MNTPKQKLLCGDKIKHNHKNHKARATVLLLCKVLTNFKEYGIMSIPRKKVKLKEKV